MRVSEQYVRVGPSRGSKPRGLDGSLAIVLSRRITPAGLRRSCPLQIQAPTGIGGSCYGVLRVAHGPDYVGDCSFDEGMGALTHRVLSPQPRSRSLQLI